MPPEGSLDLVIENGIITNVILNDAVNTRNRGDKGRVTGDKVIDATGLFVIPGLIEMHGHLPGPKGGSQGDRALEYAPGPPVSPDRRPSSRCFTQKDPHLRNMGPPAWPGPHLASV